MVIDNIGADWVSARVGKMTDQIDHHSPVQVNEENRILNIGKFKGYIDYSLTPYLIEILNCFDVNSPVREINFLKGVQIGYSTLLEGGALYYILDVPGTPIMYMSADKELAESRVEDNFKSMIEQSGLSHLYHSADRRIEPDKKTLLQFTGGTTLRPFGAKNAAKMRNYSIMVFLKDEIDGWPDTVGKDGDPDKLTDARCEQYWEVRKIFRGSTPSMMKSSKIYKQFRRGDERVYMFRCMACGFEQTLVEFSHKTGVDWYGKNKDTGKRYGFIWEMENNLLIPESVRYLCRNCSHEHFDYHMERIMVPDAGAQWLPTSEPVRPGIRSYYLPAFYSPFKKWSERIADFLECFDFRRKQIVGVGEFQVFLNNVMAWPFEPRGERIKFEAVSGHRRQIYKKGQIPNVYAAKYSGSEILFLTCLVDVQKWYLSMCVIGWCRDARSYVIDYRELRADEASGDAPCIDQDSHVWAELQEIVEEAEFTSDNGRKYKILLTLIDCGYGESYDAVINFCAQYQSGVIPIVGRDRPDKAAKIETFSEFKTQLGTTGYKIVVDYYKDRMAPVLRREWHEENGLQKRYHFNAPVDITDDELKQLTAETKREKTDNRGVTTLFWYRPSGKPNELWDLLIYGHAGVEMMAWAYCEERGIDYGQFAWNEFWDYQEETLALSR